MNHRTLGRLDQVEVLPTANVYELVAPIAAAAGEEESFFVNVNIDEAEKNIQPAVHASPHIDTSCAHHDSGEMVEPFGHFRAEPFGWVECAEDADGAIDLYERPLEGLTDEQIEAIAQTVRPIVETGHQSWEHAVIRAYEKARGIGACKGVV